MPANPRSLELEESYRRSLQRLSRRVSALLLDRFRRVDADDIKASLAEFIPVAAVMIGLGQEQAITLARAYLGSFVQAEVGDTPELVEPRAAGVTFDGRSLEEGLNATPAKVLLAIKMGRPVRDALAFGAFSVTRFATTEVVDASRHELQQQMESSEQIEGWRWNAAGSACGFCAAKDDGAIYRPTSVLIGHAGCSCVQEIVVRDVEETIIRPTGKEVFESMSKEQQNQRFGEPKAELLRSGRITFDDLVKVERHEEWRPSGTEAPLKSLV